MNFNKVVLYLIGLPGTGKYTIAKEIAQIAKFKLVDNHLINNPVLSVLDLNGKNSVISDEIWTEIRKIRAIVFDVMVKFASKSSNFVLTNNLVLGHDDGTYAKVEQMALKRQSLFVPVRLLCNIDELCKRIVNPEREARFKMTCPLAISKSYSENTVLRPASPHSFEIDVSHKTARQAAEEILNYVHQLSS